MAHHKLAVTDGGKGADVARKGPDMVQVKVLAASGVFKNGNHYAKGALAPMSREAARNHAAVGDVEFEESDND